MRCRIIIRFGSGTSSAINCRKGSESDKKQVRAVMLQNRSLREAVDSLTGLNPQNTIEGLHTKTVQRGGSFVGQIGEFLHVVAFGEKGRGRAARSTQRVRLPSLEVRTRSAIPRL